MTQHPTESSEIILEKQNGNVLHRNFFKVLLRLRYLNFYLKYIKYMKKILMKLK